MEGGPYLLQSHGFHLHIDETSALDIGKIFHDNVRNEDQKLLNSPGSKIKRMLLGESAGGALCLPEVLRRPMSMVLPLE